jgi:alkylhydroperoxidase/carboxymuconolactone decarboxylase family protein YurZ
MSQAKEEATGRWDADAMAILEGWDPSWARDCLAMSANPWRGGVLSPRLVELVSVALGVACTNLDVAGTRRHIRAALAAGATRQELVTVDKMATVTSSCSLGAPILREEAGAAGAALPSRPRVPTRRATR